MSKIKNHKRVNDIFFGPIERPALRWLANHLPAWVTPDILTVVGISGSLIIFLGYLLTNIHPAFLWLASFGFIINWFGDSLDGSLARFRHIERPKYGFYIDHVTDVLTEIITILGLGLTPYVKFSVAAMFCIAYITMSVLVYVRMNVMGEFIISYGKLGPTEARVLAILLNTGMFFGGVYTYRVNLGTVTANLSPYDLVVTGFVLLIIFIFAVTNFRQAAALLKSGE